MARIKLAYVGGGSSRAPGTMASFLAHGEEFRGSEVSLVDLDADHLDITRRVAEKLARSADLDITVTATTDLDEGLEDVDGVLTSFRPGGFEMRRLDERIPFRHGVIGQETQGPGGLMMSLRSITVMKDILDALDRVAPDSKIFNYTNPVNIVSQAISDHSDRFIYSMCEGPITFPEPILRTAGLDPSRAEIVMAGVNHNCWSTTHRYDGEDLIPLLEAAWLRVETDASVAPWDKRMLHLAVAMRSVPSDYFRYYYFGDQFLLEQSERSTTRAEDIMRNLPDYWAHYSEQADAPDPVLDPDRSRGGIHELELAIDVMSAFYNDTSARLPVNLRNDGALPDFSDSTVVEVWCDVDGRGAHPIPQEPLPHAVRGITLQLAEFQQLAADAAWDGTGDDAIRALVAHPFVRSLDTAEALYADLAEANRRYIPERLWS